MPLCDIQPQPAVYGLGIRLAFYIQWLGFIVVAYVDETNLDDVRLLGVLLSSGASLGFIIGAANKDLQAAELYIVLLLAAGAFLFLVPVYIWRGLTLLHPYWDLLRWVKEQPSPIMKTANFVLLVVVASLGTWLFTTYLPGLDKGCIQYGYFFGRVSLTDSVYIAFNAMLYVVILAVCVIFILIKFGCNIRFWEKRHHRKKPHSMHLEVLRAIRTFFYFAVFGSVVAAIELSVSWNELDTNTNRVDTLAQTVPLLVSAGFTLRSILQCFVLDDDESSSGRSRSTGRSRGKVRTSTYRRTVVEETTNIPPPPPPAASRR